MDRNELKERKLKSEFCACCGPSRPPVQGGPQTEIAEKDLNIKEIVRKNYGKIATQSGSCCSGLPTNDMDRVEISRAIGYSELEIDEFSDANLGLGCGNPTALARLKKGDTVLDLGSGAGFDAFLAARMVGGSGSVIGVDMTPEMIAKARENAKRYGFSNVEFRRGDIEELPVEDNSIDAIISNCVINLAPDKLKVFREAHRVLKRGGRMYVSDIVLLDDIPEEMRMNEELITGCVGGALLKDHYLAKIEEAGFTVRILEEDLEISRQQYQGIPLESLKVEAVKP